MSDDGRPTREHGVAYLLGNASGLGIPVAVIGIVYEAGIVIAMAILMLLLTFVMFWHYPWNALYLPEKNA